MTDTPAASHYRVPNLNFQQYNRQDPSYYEPSKKCIGFSMHAILFPIHV